MKVFSYALSFPSVSHFQNDFQILFSLVRTRGYNEILCSTQLSMKIFLLISVTMPNNCWHFNTYEQEK